MYLYASTHASTCFQQYVIKSCWIFSERLLHFFKFCNKKNSRFSTRLLAKPGVGTSPLDPVSIFLLWQPGLHCKPPADLIYVWSVCYRTCHQAGVLVRKLSQLTPLSKAKLANPRYFVMLCGVSRELAGCVHRPTVDSESTTAGWGQTKP